MVRKRMQWPLIIGVGLVFFMSFVTAYVLFAGKGAGSGLPQTAAKKLVEKAPVISETTVIEQEIIFACNDKVTTTIPTTSKYIGLDYKAVAKEFPAEEGWVIDDSVNNRLVISRHEAALCPYHRQFRHLGIDEGFLAIFEGPLGFNDKVLQRESVPVYLLPPETQEDLNKAMNYSQQNPDVQQKLKNQLEFEEENQLGTVLENFDEYMED